MIHYFNGDECIFRLAIKYEAIYYLNEAMSVYRLFSVGSWSAQQLQLSNDEQVKKLKNILKGVKYLIWKANMYFMKFYKKKFLV